MECLARASILEIYRESSQRAGVFKYEASQIIRMDECIEHISCIADFSDGPAG
jgi:hypothetical protein